MTTELWIGSLAAIVTAVAFWRLRRPRELSLDQPPIEKSFVGRYEILEKIGEGGYAEVFRVRRTGDPHGPGLAMKLQQDKEKIDPATQERFLREIQISLSLSHPNLAKVHDWGENEQGRLFMVSELLEGETLRQRMRRQPPISQREVVELTQALASALAYLHEQNMVHRDIKPDNVFLTSEGQIKLMDLGIIKSLDAAAMTRPGVVVGTPLYVSPEQIQGESSPATDQYALGVTVFELLTDNRPFRGTSMEVIEQHLYREPPKLGKFRRGCPSTLEEVVAKMLAKEPAERFPDIAGAVEALCQALEGFDDEDGQLETVITVLNR